MSTLAEDLQPGDRIAYAGVVVTVLRQREPLRDRLGRDMWKLWSRREDSGAEGYLIFGPGASVQRLCACGHTKASHAPSECVGCTGPECR